MQASFYRLFQFIKIRNLRHTALPPLIHSEAMINSNTTENIVSAIVYVATVYYSRKPHNSAITTTYILVSVYIGHIDNSLFIYYGLKQAQREDLPGTLAFVSGRSISQMPTGLYTVWGRQSNH